MREIAEPNAVPPPFWPALLAGAVIGLISGMTGTGGGIFLAPVMLLMNWVEIRRAAAVTAAYNLLNSVAAFAGAYATIDRLPANLPIWLAAAGVGGVIGTTIGNWYLPPKQAVRILALLLIISGIRLIVA